jgi:rhodanese-related sulfurtransferase
MCDGTHLLAAAVVRVPSDPKGLGGIDVAIRTRKDSAMTPTITRPQLQARLHDGLVLVDTLPSSYYAQQHLPGALNLVAEDVDSRAAELLPDKDARIVTYCSNRACSNSAQVAARLESLGYTRVLRYEDGIEDWVGADLPTEGPASTSA